MLRQKRAIAAEAAKRVSGGITIALDGSTTAWELAAHLDDPSLTIVTNSLMVTTLLASKDGPQVISVGGTLDRKLMMFTGMIAREGLRHVHVDLFFCSCGGIDPARGFSDPSEPSAQFKRQLMHTSDRTILLADSTKFEMRSPVMFASPADVVELITDAAAPGFDAARWLGQWIEQPQAALGGQKPADLLDTPTGLSVVARLLGALASGAYQ